MRKQRAAYYLGSLCLIILAGGCLGGGSDPAAKNRPPVFPVRGVVLYKGQPLDGASVVFKSASSESPAYALTGPKGQFELTTFDQGDGAVAGVHQVRITKTKLEQAPLAHPEGPIPTPKETNLIPERYGDFERSNLSATVNENGPNEFRFELSE